MNIYKKVHKPLSSILLLMGSFTFAFLLGEAVHESGHYLAHLAYANEGVHVILDPFGSSRIMGVTFTQNKVMGGVTAAAGPLFNLVLGITSFILLWKFRNPRLLPVLMWGPVAMVQEGVTFTLGFLTPGGDAEWISRLGIPQIFILSVGILIMAIGIAGTSLLLPLAGIDEHESYQRKLGVILVGMGTLMVIRFMYSLHTSTKDMLENLIPLIFSILLAIMVAFIQKPLNKTSRNIFPYTSSSSIRTASFLSLGMGASIFLLQIIL